MANKKRRWIITTHDGDFLLASTGSRSFARELRMVESGDATLHLDFEADAETAERILNHWKLARKLGAA